MLLGVSGFLRGDWLDAKASDLQKVVENGFKTALLTVADPSRGSNADMIEVLSED